MNGNWKEKEAIGMGKCICKNDSISISLSFYLLFLKNLEYILTYPRKAKSAKQLSMLIYLVIPTPPNLRSQFGWDCACVKAQTSRGDQDFFSGSKQRYKSFVASHELDAKQHDRSFCFISEAHFIRSQFSLYLLCNSKLSGETHALSQQK